MSLKEFSSIDKEKAENMRKEVKTYLDQMLRLRLGLEEVELEWTCDGTIYKTVCVVSGTLGISTKMFLSTPFSLVLQQLLCVLNSKYK